MNAADHHVMVEFVCERCLASVQIPDDARRPICARCGIRMLPDSDERWPKLPHMTPRKRVGET